ncbi:MAG TPA: AfsA-related hotdog domain-containing protein, partial [Spirochaetota bacterium]|nr:AfsA-related hotdog domain-containing protein [Spirochaetota bacterium]
MPHNINFDEILFPEKKYLHKDRKENVHIYNLRRSLPRVIIKEIFEKDILQELNPEEKEFILTYYIKRKIVIGDTESGGDADAYVLRSLPVSFSIEAMEGMLQDPHMIPAERDLILGCYKKRVNENNYILSCDISELDELRIANILKIKWLLVNDADKKRISDILERIKQFQKNDIFIANMHVDPEHEYFFEHKLDHVPGMMAIETARQFFLACAHVYG